MRGRNRILLADTRSCQPYLAVAESHIIVENGFLPHIKISFQLQRNSFVTLCVLFMAISSLLMINFALYNLLVMFFWYFDYFLG